MSEKRFVQACFIAVKPKPEDFGRALAYARAAWQYLDQHGFGNDKPATPRKGLDYYQALSAYQLSYFDRFWEAFNLKKGRNGAAMRWAELVDAKVPAGHEPSQAFYEHIIAAAAKEAARQLPAGQVRKEAQGWLNDLRFLDFAPTKTKAVQQKTNVVGGLRNELAALERLNTNGSLDAQIQALERRIKDAAT